MTGSATKRFFMLTAAALGNVQVASAYFAKRKELLAQKEAGDAAAEQKLQELEVRTIF